MSKIYKWGILGAGRIAEKFCTAINFTEGSEVYAVASRNVENGSAFAARFNAVRSYDNYAALAADENVDIIYIATPHAFHYEHAMLCLQHKKPVLCEKPLSLNLRQTSEMIEAANTQQVFFMEGLWTACMPFLGKIRTLIADGAIGQPQYVGADFGFAAPKDFEGRLFNKSLGGGSVLDIGIYPLSLATIILGAPTAISTFAQLAPTGVDEYANVIMQYGDGATAHILSTINFPTPIEAVIIGTNGRIEIHSPWFKATDFSLYSGDNSPQHFSIPHLSNGFEHEINEVTCCLDNQLLQSNKVPHALTLSLSKIMDEVLQQAGVQYEVLP
jgi:predicted dehydrogenase